jgi:hypothetical protein
MSVSFQVSFYRTLTSSIVEVWVEKTLQYVVGNLLGTHAFVVPSFHYELNGVLDDSLRNFSSRLVQQERKMVLKSCQRSLLRGSTGRTKVAHHTPLTGRSE